MMSKALRSVALIAALSFAGGLPAEAFPVWDGAPSAAPSVELVQYGPGYHSRQQYRRAMRRYRGNPGARHELRQNRRIYCRNTPERC